MTTNNTIKDFKDLLTTTICEQPDSYIIKELFKTFPTINTLISATERDLIKIKGIGPVKAKQIYSALGLAKINKLFDDKLPVIETPMDVFNLVYRMQFYDKEHFVILGLNTKNMVIFEETISVGSLNSSIVHPRECFKPLIRFSCASTVLIHNHPSGDPKPSSEDISITKRLVEAGKLLGIKVHDHIIIGQNVFFSMKGENVI